MALARKIILHSPVSDSSRLRDFIERCLAEKVLLLAIVGREADKLEDQVDWIVVGDGSDPSRFLCTTSHPHESLEDVLDMANAWEADADACVEQVFL
ncbi:hypothetical protein [Rhizobium sp. P44RR-XXIV]|uniref:hypothetical protein n=1 Tax=Rhizobium sp. P44RR-XXIV TaxID=1921145 RepID=UPI000985922D|nr:hypothetical protein [Rhizobium sp. P44RR-XXIV]TIX89868.1 hypothetical protein BSK43_025465 [Rhizobium sp. P44RR-XXIV]